MPARVEMAQGPQEAPPTLSAPSTPITKKRKLTDSNSLPSKSRKIEEETSPMQARTVRNSPVATSDRFYVAVSPGSKVGPLDNSKDSQERSDSHKIGPRIKAEPSSIGSAKELDSEGLEESTSGPKGIMLLFHDREKEEPPFFDDFDFRAMNGWKFLSYIAQPIDEEKWSEQLKEFDPHILEKFCYQNLRLEDIRTIVNIIQEKGPHSSCSLGKRECDY